MMRIERFSTQTRSHRIASRGVCGLALIIYTIGSSAYVRPASASSLGMDTPAAQFTITPNQGTPNKQLQMVNYPVVVRSVNCKQVKITGASLLAPENSGLIVAQGKASDDDCVLNALISIKSDASYGPIVLQVKSGAVLLGTVTFTVAPPTFLMSPARGVPGKEYDITVTTSDCNQHSLRNAVLTSPQGSGINITKIDSTIDQGCSMTANISIEKEAPYGDVAFRLIDEKGNIFGLVPFSIISKPPEPIPPGLEPQIDIMWSVIPWKIVSDNFGRRVAKLYYGIEVIIGNNSGFDLQIVSTGFTIPKLAQQARALGLKFTVPSNSYKMTRGSIEWEQSAGWRNFAVNLIKGLGPVATGFTPFFHVVSHRSNYAEGLNVFSSPFEKGFELVFPDKTIRNLERLDDQILRDGLIIHNNLQVKTNVFVPKDIVGLTDTEGRNEPQKVMLALGELVIIGDRIQHINRVKVTSSSEGGPVPIPATVAPAAQSVTQGASTVLHYNGIGLESLQADRDADGVDVEQPKSDEGGRGFSVKVTAKDDAKPGTHFLNIRAIQGDSIKTIQIPFEVKAATPKVPDSIDTLKALVASLEDQHVQITIPGQFLKGVSLEVEPKDLTVTNVDNTQGDKLTAKLNIPGKFSGNATLTIKNGDQVSKIAFEVKPQGAPQGSLTVADPGSNVAKLKNASSFDIKITGSNLKGAKVETIGTAKTEKIDAEGVKVDDAGANITATITVPRNVPPNDFYQLRITNASGTIDLAFAISSQADPIIKTTKRQPDTPPQPGQFRTMTITGDNLDGASLEQIPDSDGTLEISDVTTAKDHISAKITVPAAAKPKTYQLKVENTGNKKLLSFEVQAPNQ